MTSLAIISCSNSKKSGGEAGEYPKSVLADYLSHEKYQLLMKLRRQLATILDLEPGPDFGYAGEGGSIKFLPVHKRYSGKMFTLSGIKDMKASDVPECILVVSGLYGILHIHDYIRDYNLRMQATLPNGTRVLTWWKQRGLGSIVTDLIENFGLDELHDLLGKDYRKALSPWPSPQFADTYVEHSFSRGFQALNEMGDDLKTLMQLSLSSCRLP